MSDDATETLGVEEGEASGTPTTNAIEGSVNTDTAVNDQVNDVSVAEDANPALEQDGEGKSANDSAQDRKLTRENASLRKRLREAEAALKKQEEAEMSEQERQERRIAEMESKINAADKRVREASLNLAVSTAATRLDVVDPEAAVMLIDTSVLDYDPDSNTWSGVDEAMSDLIDQRPWLVGSKPSPPKESSPANPARRRTRLTADQLKEMSAEEINALPWEDVHAALSDA